jgi:hypothetical protein
MCVCMYECVCVCVYVCVYVCVCVPPKGVLLLSFNSQPLTVEFFGMTNTRNLFTSLCRLCIPIQQRCACS